MSPSILSVMHARPSSRRTIRLRSGRPGAQQFGRRSGSIWATHGCSLGIERAVGRVTIIVLLCCLGVTESATLEAGPGPIHRRALSSSIAGRCAQSGRLPYIGCVGGTYLPRYCIVHVQSTLPTRQSPTPGELVPGTGPALISDVAHLDDSSARAKTLAVCWLWRDCVLRRRGEWMSCRRKTNEVRRLPYRLV